jgi:putative selenium metabolism protein SsnA
MNPKSTIDNPQFAVMLITNGTLITLSDAGIIENGAVLIRDGLIADIGTTQELIEKYSATLSSHINPKSKIQNPKLIDAGGKLILPGNICSHTHFYGAFARGMAVPGAPARNFIEILQKLWWKLDRALDLDGVKYSALVCMVDAIKNGTTTLIDHHASPNAIEGSLDAIADAADASGLRAALCYEVTDRNGKVGAQRGIAENIRFAQQSKIQNPKSKIRAAMGIHAAFTVDDDTLDTAAGAANDAGLPIHIHVAEDRFDEADSATKYGLTVVERLARHNALSERTIAAHCIHINEREIARLAEAGAKVTHQPRSNMNNAVGVANVPAMLARGICVGLGNDGFSNDAFAEMKVCDMLHKVSAGDPRAMGADKVMRMAYANNAEIARLFWPEMRGTLEVGQPADVIVMDYKPFTPLTAGNLPWHMLFGMSGGMVTHTICNGMLLMADRKLLALDENEIVAKANEAAVRAWRRVEEMGD